MNLVLSAILIGSLTATSYRSVPNQTDDSPFVTSTGERVHKHGVAVSRDLLERWGGPIKYGDWVYIEGYGFKVVNDCMNERHKNRIDIWVASYEEEKAVGVRKAKVWLVKPILKEAKHGTKRMAGR